ncbi:MAG: FtsH protease activity modulator HflK [Rhodoferax sp.]
MESNSQTSVAANQTASPPSKLNQLREWVRYYAALLGLKDRGGLLVIAIIALMWVNSGIFKVQPDEQGIVLRFGRFQEAVESGLHYHWPYPIETVMLPKVTQMNQLQLGVTKSGSGDDSHERQMLTGDENIVEAECAVFWKIKNAKDFLFKVKNPETSVRIVAESALREVIGRTPIQAAMSDKRQQIADETRVLMQTLLDQENAGILVSQVQLQRVDPPAAVIDAFNDVQRARADQERTRNEADSYANDMLPRARGEASKITQEAEAYKEQAVKLAEGDAKGFLSVYNSYVKSKDVTAWRLYMESTDELLRKASRVIVDTTGKGASAVMPYMSIGDKDKPASKEAAK